MIEPMALIALASLLAAIAAGFSYLHRTAPRCPRWAARTCTHAAAGGTPTTVRSVHNGDRDRCESADSPLVAGHHRAVDQRTSSRTGAGYNTSNVAAFGRRGPADVGVHPVVATSAGADPIRRTPDVPRSHKILYRADLRGVLPLGPSANRDVLRLAVRAVYLHGPSEWPEGVYCSNDRSPFPCRLRRWGEDVLLTAGWRPQDVDALGR